MPDLVDSYLSHLTSKLRRDLPKDVAHEHVREIAAHLRESIAERVSAGESEEAAAEAAIRGVGSDALVADSLVRAHSGISQLSVWRVALVPTLILFAFWFGPLSANSILSSAHAYIVWIPCLPLTFIGTFCYACWRSRRFLMAPIAAAMGLLLLIVCVQYQSSFFKAGLRFKDDVDAVAARESRTYLMRDKAALAQATTLAEMWKSKSPMSTPGSQLAPVSYLDKGPSTDRTPRPVHRHALVLVGSATEAKALWQKNGDLYLRMLQGSVRADERSPYLNPNHGVPPLSAAIVPWSEGFGGVWLCLAALNLIILGLGRWYRATITRNWRPARLA
jgi:hypothetical protein